MTITDADTAILLSDRLRGRYLDPFLNTETTVAEAAAALGVSAQRMHYWVSRFQELGLLRQVRTEANGRSRARVFTTTAPEFTFPLELLPTSDFETLELYFKPVWHSFLTAVASSGRRHSDGWQVRLSRQNGQPAFHIVPTNAAAAQSPLLNSWLQLELTEERALLLKEELQVLLQKYAADPAAEHDRRYLIHLGLAELPNIQ